MRQAEEAVPPCKFRTWTRTAVPIVPEGAHLIMASRGRQTHPKRCVKRPGLAVWGGVKIAEAKRKENEFWRELFKPKQPKMRSGKESKCSWKELSPLGRESCQRQRRPTAMEDDPDSRTKQADEVNDDPDEEDAAPKKANG